MRIAAAADHAGYRLKDELLHHLRSLGHEVEDLGTGSEDSVDYPDFASRVAAKLTAGEADRGLLVCGTGVGMAMTANRFPSVRAVQTSDPETLRLARSHNDANLLALGARLIEPEQARALLDVFLEEPFSGGRHRRRVSKMDSVPSD